MFQEFLDKILEASKTGSFKEQTRKVVDYVDSLADEDIKRIVKEIGTIPECIRASSSEEKLFSKSSDIILARCFRMLGLKSKAVAERADSADVIAESLHHKYSLVADAKCFRMSRTAKNQKDFKVAALSNWRGGENEYAVLVSPYFQYPKAESQIYKTALDNNVCLLAWEHISILLDYNISENENFSLETIWNSSSMLVRDSKISYENAKCCFLPKINFFIAKKMGVSLSDFLKLLNEQKLVIVKRGSFELAYCENKIEEIKSYTYEQAISELIKETKLEEKISVINSYLSSLGDIDE
ncbi:HindIII family type II restriction endonuclease [uncultured Treponema sp.]|uniref:HindIII family type II restriction endonuclease n=1 Tax=uncultured Treponema sp. TaxID=162155 RepID=UPI002616F726|nr:HindIII family type II restriction endonuclease [uncultured Treponema sp.]